MRKKKRSNKPSQEKIKLYRERARRVNDLIRVIASCGRRFFSEATEYHKDEAMVGRIGCIEVDANARLWWVDAWRGQRVFLNTPSWGRWEGFHHGGTLRQLVKAFMGFIRTGKPIAGYFGPFPDWILKRDPWAYGHKNMEKIEREAQRLGIRPSKSGYDELTMEDPAFKYAPFKGMTVGLLQKALEDLPKNMPVVLEASDHNYYIADSASVVEAHDQGRSGRYPYGQWGGEEAAKDYGPKKNVFYIT